MFKAVIIIGALIAGLCISNAQVFKEACLKAHHRFRDLHGSPKMTLDDNLQKVALEWAKHLGQTNTFEHRPNNKYGENLFVINGVDHVIAYTAVKAWYDEIKDYNYNKPGFSMETGHFTQVVWKKSVKLGCGFYKNGTSIYVVANYDPPGNYAGQFPANVAKRKK